MQKTYWRYRGSERGFFPESLRRWEIFPGLNDAKELQKLSGLGLVSCSSGKHKGETRISHRGRKRLRYWLFQAARSAVAHGEEYKWIHAHYTNTGRKSAPEDAVTDRDRM